MPEQFLNRAEIGSGRKHMSRVRVTKSMRVDRPVIEYLLRVEPHDGPSPTVGEAPAPMVQKDCGFATRRRSLFHVLV